MHAVNKYLTVVELASGVSLLVLMIDSAGLLNE